ncbi:ATP-binding protein [Pseudonocardia saturnea]
MGVPAGGAGRRSDLLPLPASPVIGRDAELATLASWLAGPDPGMITLTGPPGVGKTRLAIAAAAAAGAGFTDGAVFVDLTAIRDPDLVLPEVARALGLGEAQGRSTADRLAPALGDRNLLLVVDNFEHVLDAGPALSAPLGACPHLRVLATSRERLRLRGEREFPVSPLALPRAEDVDDLALLVGTPSIAVLLHQVRGWQPDFEVTAANAPALAEICRRLDGLPLALELAAARMTLFTPAELTFRLRHRMALLTGGCRDAPDRHRTLRAALTWSHDLLTADERTVFRRLSVFVGTWTLDAAAHVCGSATVLDTVSSLRDKSLVRRVAREGAAAGFGMLESLREYAAERLAEHGEVEATRTRHAEFYAALAMRTEAGIGTATESTLVDAGSAVRANLRTAVEHALATHRTDAALWLAAGLGWHCYTRGHLGQGQRVLDRALAAAGAGAQQPPGAEPLAAALQVAGALAVARGGLDEAEQFLDRSLEQAVDPRRRAIDSAFRGHLARARGDTAGAVGHHRRAGSLFAALGNEAGVAWSRYDLGLLARRRGDVEQAADHLREGLDCFRDIGYAWAAGCAAWALADVELRRGRVDEAAVLLVEALGRVAASDDGRGLAQCLEAAAGVACERGAHRSAGQALGAAAVLRERLAAPLPDEDRGAHHALTQRVRRELGPQAADTARRCGRGLPTERVFALALQLVAEPPSVPAAPRRPARPLTPREDQVARLVAAGHTNRQIGRALGISEKTTEVHVHHIIGKLGAHSRSQVAAWVGAGGVPSPDR